MGEARMSWLEWRRKRAWELSEEVELSQREIAVVLNASEAAVSKWICAARIQGPRALAAKPHPGHPTRLTAEQIQLIPDFLWHGAEAYGFRGNVWTCPRVVQVLVQEFGLRYSRSQVSRLLRHKLGWTPQMPLTKAIQADPVAIEQWRVMVWPEVQRRANKEHRCLVFIDESGFYLLPEVVRTYAPRGCRPVQREWQTHDHLSVIGALTPEGKIYSWVRQDSLKGHDMVDFLFHLLRVISEPLLIIWDNSPIHRGPDVKQFLAAGGARCVQIEPLPTYAPELNPVEWLWGQCKRVEMGNLACPDLEDLHMEFHLALGRIRQKPWLTKSFFAGAGLAL